MSWTLVIASDVAPRCLGMQQPVDLTAGRAALGTRGARDDQAQRPRSLRPERLEQLEHACIVGVAFARERVSDVTGKVPVADRNRVEVACDHVQDLRRGPRSDAADTEETLREHTGVGIRRTFYARRLDCASPYAARTPQLDAQSPPLPVGKASE